MNTTNLITGLLTGFGATIAMTLLMMLGMKMGLAPLNMPLMLGRQMLGPTSEESSAKKVGLLIHLLMGSLLGLIYHLMIGNQILFSEISYRTGLLFSLLPWALMMIVMMPMMGMGIFGFKKSPMVLPMTLVMHLAYGGILVYLSSI